ncbi:MAG: GDSL-type esterase/lipase family protein [Victivallales bacterium]|jgi:lysophospholipase L1-like esterase
MIHKNIEFHNVGELGRREGYSGLFLYRYPADVREHMIQLGQVAATNSSGVEIRFCTDADWGTVTLSVHCEYPWQTAGKVDLYKGDFFCGSHMVKEGRQCTIRLTQPPLLRELNDRAFADSQFSPNVWRLVLADGIFIFHEVSSPGKPVRPPKKEEKPGLRWLAYGSSITNAAPDGYAHQAARLLGADLLNKGMCGSCFCEKETARYLAIKENWDFITLELGVNMRGSCTAQEFEKRASEFISIIRKSNKSKPIVLITIFPNIDDFRKKPNDLTVFNREYRQALRNIVEKSKDKNLHLIEGDKVLTRFGSLAQDVIHPSSSGHALMGKNLSALIAPLI